MIAADKVFTTCCALHNWLLEVDGLGAWWEESVRSDWDSGASYVDGACDEKNMVPDAVVRLRHPVKQHNYDLSGMGAGSDGYTEHKFCYPTPEENNVSTHEEHHRSVHDDTLRMFRLCGICRCVISILDLSPTSILPSIKTRS